MSFVSPFYETAAQLAAANPVVPKGAVAAESDTGVVKIGDGSTRYNSLPTALNSTYAPLDTGLVPRLPTPPSAITWITTFPAGHGYTASSATITDDTTTFALGSQSLRFVSTSASASAQITKTGITAFDTTGKTVVVLVKIDDFGQAAGTTAGSIATPLIGNIELLLSNDSGFSNFYTLQTWSFSTSLKPALPGEWVLLRFPWTSSLEATTGSPTRSGMTTIRFRFATTANVSAGTPLNLNIGGIGMVPDTSTYANGVVSFTFDDTFASHYTTAKSYLDKYGYPGTAYIIRDRVGTSGRMTLAQLKDMQNLSGWEICGHADTLANHDNRLTSLTSAQIEADMSGMKTWLLSNGFTGQSYAYPGGVYTRSIADSVAKRFNSAATVADEPRFNLAQRPDYQQLTRFDNSASGNLVSAKARLDSAKADKSWIILTHHDIGAAAKVTVSEFQQLVDYANSIGIAVKTVGQVIEGR